MVIKDKNAFTYEFMPKHFPYHNLNLFIINLKVSLLGLMEKCYLVLLCSLTEKLTETRIYACG
jgi:hypothetical protein